MRLVTCHDCHHGVSRTGPLLGWWPQVVSGQAGLGWAGLGWAGPGCAGLGWAGLAENLRTGRVKSNHQSKCCKHLSTPITFHKIRFPSIHHLPSSCHSCSSYQSCCLYHPSYCSLTQILFFLRISQFQFSVFILREKMLWPHHEMYFIMLPSAGWVAAS